jgi:hypothetical protein
VTERPSPGSRPSRSPVDPLLDACLFAPIGLVLDAKRRLDEAAARGRAELTPRVALARMVGRFAVTQARREIARRFGGGNPPAGAAGAAGTPARPAAAGGPPVRAPGPDEDEIIEVIRAEVEATGEHPAPDELVTSDVEPPAAATHDAEQAEGLAIPGYDSLAASQIVSRLDGLTPEELEAVRRYEAAHRARSTVLGRIAQLQA